MASKEPRGVSEPLSCQAPPGTVRGQAMLPNAWAALVLPHW